MLLHLYATQGPGFLERLNGIFALALYDGRHSGRREGIESGDVLLARDGLGVKPLYFAHAGGGVLFASELKAILASSEVPRDLDLVAIDQYLTYLWAPAPRTPLRTVKKMRPGEALVLRGGAVTRSWIFYELPQAEDCRRHRVAVAQGNGVAAQLASEVEAAVRRQLLSDVPVGAFLSGGLDSSAVVAMMRRADANSPTVAYTMDFQGADRIEGNPADLPYARQAAAHLGVDLEIVRAGPEMINELERMLWCLDEPQADPAPINALLICERAAKDGLKVLMSGAGGDDILGGYRRHQALRSERLWSWLPRAARGALAGASRALQCGAIPGPGMRRPLVRRLAKTFAHANLDGDARIAAYLEWTPEWRRRALLTPPVQAEIHRQDPPHPLAESLARVRNDADPLERMLYIDAKHFLADHNLNYTDKTGMYAGVEVRVPLLDLQVVDLAAAIPSHQKIAGGTLKHVFKKAMEPYLPREVIYRPKSGFAAPLRQWLHSDLVELRREVLSKRSLTQRGLFEFDEVRRLVEADRRGRVDAAYTSLACAAEHIRGDTYISFGDIIFKRYVLQALQGEPGDVVIVVDSNTAAEPPARYTEFIKASRPYTPAYTEEPVLMDKMDPDLHPDNADGESIGLMKLTKTGANALRHALEQLRSTEGFETMRMSRLLNHLVAEGAEVRVTYIAGNWLDIDDIEKYSEALEF